MREPRAYRVRSWWPTVVAGSLAVLGACSRSEKQNSPPGQTVVEQAHDIYSALASVQAALVENARAPTAILGDAQRETVIAPGPPPSSGGTQMDGGIMKTGMEPTGEVPDGGPSRAMEPM
jgi:hypothetical protein